MSETPKSPLWKKGDPWIGASTGWIHGHFSNHSWGKPLAYAWWGGWHVALLMGALSGLEALIDAPRLIGVTGLACVSRTLVLFLASAYTLTLVASIKAVRSVLPKLPWALLIFLFWYGADLARNAAVVGCAVPASAAPAANVAPANAAPAMRAVTP